MTAISKRCFYRPQGHQKCKSGIKFNQHVKENDLAAKTNAGEKWRNV